MHAQACRAASGAGVCGPALLEPAVLASVLQAASPRGIALCFLVSYIASSALLPH